MADVDKPFPPGHYPVVVVGSGPGGIQTSYFLSKLGIEHALLSEDDEPGGMFRRFPIFQRLISWTKPYSPAARESREYEWYDWNSLLSEEPANRGLCMRVMDGTSYFPARSEMEAAIVSFVEAEQIQIRYGCTWESTRRTDDGFVLTTSDGEYSCKVPIFAVGMAQPWKPVVDGLEDVPHYVETRPRETYADKRVVLIGKRNSGFELGDGLLPYARQLILVSPRPTGISVLTHSVGAARARYLQPYEDYILGGGNFVIDAAIEKVERDGEGFRVHARGTTRPGPYVIEADEVIAATGFQVPMRDLRDLGVATVMQDRAPALTPLWESASCPGVYFAGTISQGAPGLRKYGMASSSPAVHGFRYNARIMVNHIAEKHFGKKLDAPALGPDDAVDNMLEEATHAPELWAQKSYLAHCVETRDGELCDLGIWPLQHFVDNDGPDGAAIAIEIDNTGDIHPALYVRRKGAVEEHLLPSTAMNDFRTAEHRDLLKGALGTLLNR